MEENRTNRTMKKHLIVGTPFLRALFLIFSLYFFVSAPVYAKKIEEKPDILMDEPITLIVDLENESRFLGMDVYQIAEYKDGTFSYIEPYNELDITPYRKLSRGTEIDNVAHVIEEYIIENQIEPTAQISCKKGIGKANGLKVGVYLLIQNDSDHNAMINKSYVVEAPMWADETEEYLYEIHLFPKWKQVVWFSFRPEVVFPLMKVFTLMICLALCIWGPRIIRNAFLSVIAMLSGLLGMKMGMAINGSFLALMLFFILFAFIGLGLMLFILMLFESIIKKVMLYDYLQRKQFWIVPLIGAVLFSYFTYSWFIKNIWIVTLVFVALSILGIVLQYLKKDEQIIFHTYDDLLLLNREGETNDP